MARGRHTKLTGATGEFLVAAELCRRGLLATPFAGNVPHYDVIASSQAGGHLVVQVKAINGSTWQFDIRRFMDVELHGNRQVPGTPKSEPYPRLTVVLVGLKNRTRPVDRFFVMRWIDLRDILNRNYGDYLEKHNGVRPRAPESFHIALPLADIVDYEDGWQLLLTAADE